MNQNNNNIIDNNSQTEQAVYTNQNINMQQPGQPQSTLVQPQMNTGYTQPVQNQPSKKSKKTFVIVAVLVVVAIIAGILLFNNNDKKESTNNKIPNNSTGSLEEGTNTTYDENGAFLLSIEDVFTITGRGTVVTGMVERGKIRVGDEAQIIGLSDEILTTEVREIKTLGERKDETTAGEKAEILLKDVLSKQVERGQVLAKPNSIVSATKFDAEVYILTKEEGGRTTPFFDGYSAQFYFRTTDITGKITLPKEIEMVNPGDTVTFTTTLLNPVAMEEGTEFKIREGSRIIGKGKVTKVY